MQADVDVIPPEDCADRVPIGRSRSYREESSGWITGTSRIRHGPEADVPVYIFPRCSFRMHRAENEQGRSM
jgi:hypothetical protein